MAGWTVYHVDLDEDKSYTMDFFSKVDEVFGDYGSMRSGTLFRIPEGRHYTSKEDGQEDLQKFLNSLDESELDMINYLIHVCANNTSDSGDAHIWKLEDGELTFVEAYQGYEGANANDIRGRIEDDYGIELCVRPSY